MVFAQVSVSFENDALSDPVVPVLRPALSFHHGPFPVMVVRTDVVWTLQMWYASAHIKISQRVDMMDFTMSGHVKENTYPWEVQIVHDVIFLVAPVIRAVAHEIIGRKGMSL